MNLFEAFNKLDRINLRESAADDFKQITGEINQLKQEIAELEQQKTQGWDTKYAKRFKAEADELHRLSVELDRLVATYRTKYYSDWDADGDPTDIAYHVDEKKKAEVAEAEAELRKRLEEVEKKVSKLQAEARAEYEAEFAIHNKTIADKRAALTSKDEHKKSTITALLEEERAELEKLCNKVSGKLTPEWESFTINNDKAYLRLTSKPFDVEIEADDFDDDDNFMADKTLEIATENYLESDEYYEIIDDFLGTEADELDWSIFNKNSLIDIPGSQWKLASEVDLTIIGDEPEVTSHWYDSGDYWNPPEGEFEFDTSMEVQATFYLIKQL